MRCLGGEPTDPAQPAADNLVVVPAAADHGRAQPPEPVAGADTQPGAGLVFDLPGPFAQ
jgi:hypothetical protein